MSLFFIKKKKKNRSLLSSQHPTAAFGHFELIESVINKQWGKCKAKSHSKLGWTRLDHRLSEKVGGRRKNKGDTLQGGRVRNSEKRAFVLASE